MRLLFDQNLPVRLVESLADLFPKSAHVKPLGLSAASDAEIWHYARTNEFAIISKDGDFSQLSLLHGNPPKVISLKIGNASTREIEALIRIRAETIAEFNQRDEDALLVLGA